MGIQIETPNGMLMAAQVAYRGCVDEDKRVQEIVRAVLYWQTLNAPYPTPEQSIELSGALAAANYEKRGRLSQLCELWVEQMYLKR